MTTNIGEEKKLDKSVTVDGVFVDGLARTNDDLITNQLKRLFKTKTFSEMITVSNTCKLELERLGIFKSIEVFVDLADSNNPDYFNVHYNVEML